MPNGAALTTDMRIGQIVDHPKRDLGGAALLAHEIARRGAEPVIIPMYEQGVDIPRLGLDVVIANYARPANRELLADYAAAGTKVFVLDTEGGVLADRGANSPAELARSIRDNGYAALIEGYMFWGTALRDAFLEAGALPPERLHVTGCPRFDFTGLRWRGMLGGERSGYLLVNANFPLVNPRFSGSRQREREAMVSAGWEPGYVDRLMSDLSAVFPRYLETVRELASSRPNLQLLVRPHPFENEAPYREVMRGLPNVTIDGAGSVLNAIQNSIGILHLNCGTAVEAVMLEKLPLQMGFLDTPATAGHARLPARVSRGVGSFADLLAAVDRIADETARFPFESIHRQYVYPYFYERDGRAAARVADIVVKAAAQRTRLPARSLGAVLRCSRPKPTGSQRLYGVVSAVLGSAAASSLRIRLDRRRRDKAICPEDLSKLVDRIAAHEGSRPSRVSRVFAARIGPPLASLRVSVGRA